MTHKDNEFQDVLDQLSTLAPGQKDAPKLASHALAQVRQQLQPVEQTPWWKRSNPIMHRRRTIAAGFTMILLIAVLFSFPAVRTAASDFLGLFRVQKFAPITVSPQQMAILEQLAEQEMVPGDLHINREPGALIPIDSLSEGSVQTGLTVKTLAFLGEPDEIHVVEGGDGYLVVDLQASRAVVEAAGADPALLPDSLDGARIDVIAFPGVQQTWREDIIFTQAASPLVEYPDDIDPAVLGEALLQVLGTEPREARRIARSIDWAGTLLLPIPQEMVTFSEVTVDGVTGAALSPLDGQGGAIMWQKEGNVYLLTTKGSLDELLALADSIE